MSIKKVYALVLALFSFASATAQAPQRNVADEVVWMVGDEPILLSEIETQKMLLRLEQIRNEGNPDCFIPEQIAVQKLFLNQAKIDSIEISEQQVSRYVESWIEHAVSQLGSTAKLEEYFSKKLSQIKEDKRIEARNGEIVRSMQSKIVQNVTISPSEIRNYFNNLPTDSLPYIPKTLEIQRIALKPSVELTEIDRVKDRLRGFAEEVNSGSREFSMLARLYSEDKKTALQGGEYGFVGRASLDADFANVVFNLSDPKRASQIVRTEDGYHIVQLIERRGDMVNFRHILLRPDLNDQAIIAATARLDSIVGLIKNGDLTFERAAEIYSEDKNTYNNGGLMINRSKESDFEGSPNFRMEDLPQDIARVVNGLKPGELSNTFIQRHVNGIQEVVVVRLKEIHPEHIANMNSDFRTIKEMALAHKREQEIENWIRRKQRQTPIQIRSRQGDCSFRYPGWIQERDE